MATMRDLFKQDLQGSITWQESREPPLRTQSPLVPWPQEQQAQQEKFHINNVETAATWQRERGLSVKKLVVWFRSVMLAHSELDFQIFILDHFPDKPPGRRASPVWHTGYWRRAVARPTEHASSQDNRTWHR